MIGTFSNRQTYIIDPSKIVRWVFVDVEGRIPQHPGEVLDKLKELQRAG
jgi:peroxiredoxin